MSVVRACDLFVSHSSKDDEWVHRLVERLRATPVGEPSGDRNFTVFNDFDSIPKSVLWMERMLEGVRTSRAILWVLSPDFLASEHTHREVMRAWGKPFASLFLRDVAHDDPRWTIYGHPTHFDFRSHEAFDAEFAKLVLFLRFALFRAAGAQAGGKGTLGIGEEARLATGLLRVRSAVAMVVGEGGLEAPAEGCAWSLGDRYLLCAPHVAARVRRLLEQGARPALLRVDLPRDSAVTSIYDVPSDGDSPTGVLRAGVEGHMPGRAVLRWHDGAGRPPARLAALRVVPRTDGSFATRLAPLTVDRWGGPAVPSGDGELLAYGNPVFDGDGAIVGLLDEPVGGLCRVVPLGRPRLRSERVA